MGLNNPSANEDHESGSDSDQDHSQTPAAQAQAPSLKSRDRDTKSIEEEFNMDNYDEEDNVGLNYFSHIDADLKLSGSKDPAQNYDAASDSEDEDFYTVKRSDLMFAAATAEEDQCYVDVYVHDTVSYGLFVRQNFDLGSFPLCLEFISSFKNRDDACLLAVGTFDRAIELWDLRNLHADEPAAFLGANPSKKKTKSKKPSIPANQSHSDAVLSLHACPTSRHVMASGSADKTVRIWDLNTCRSAHTLSHHKDKVQSVQWHPTEGGLLLTAAYDKTVALVDARTNKVSSASLPADPESLLWLSDTNFLVSCEDGSINCFDTGLKKPIWSVQAHTGACTSMAKQGDVLLTCGVDGVCRVWTHADGVLKPQKEKDMKTGHLFSVAGLEDNPAYFAFGGAEAGIWNIVDGADEGARATKDDEDEEDEDEMEDEEEEGQDDDEMDDSD